MICGKCKNDGVINTVLGKDFYYCRTCKEEIGLEPVESFGTITSYSDEDAELASALSPWGYQPPASGNMPPVKQHKVSVMTGYCADCGLSGNSAYPCPGPVVKLQVGQSFSGGQVVPPPTHVVTSRPQGYVPFNHHLFLNVPNSTARRCWKCAVETTDPRWLSACGGASAAVYPHTSHTTDWGANACLVCNVSWQDAGIANPCAVAPQPSPWSQSINPGSLPHITHDIVNSMHLGKLCNNCYLAEADPAITKPCLLAKSKP